MELEAGGYDGGVWIECISRIGGFMCMGKTRYHVDS